MNIDQSITLIKNFIAEQLQATGLTGYVIGLSGGIDSALSASLAVAAVGPERVLGIIMPYQSSAPNSQTDAKKLVQKLAIDHRIVDISPMIDAYYPEITHDLRLRAGNKMARERMSILFDIAHELNCLVLGTGNRTEICLGYTTLHGDAACSINPIGELYKTEVRLLAHKMGVPESILTKPPSADLWTDQTDEGEIGVTYDDIDTILRKIIDDQVTSMPSLLETGVREEHIKRVVGLLNRNAFKRNLPPEASLGRASIPNHVTLDGSL
ncbi:MAG: NAD+ synthase [candidate division Zixibacteria bacterium]|nr:NAD+ synthase [candidate division Zixibacteria bacterium]